MRDPPGPAMGDPKIYMCPWPSLSNAYAGSRPRSGVSLPGSEVVKLRRRGFLTGGQHVEGRGAVLCAAGERGERGEPHALVEGARPVQRGVEGALKERGIGDMRVFACDMDPDLSFDAFQEGGLTLKGTRRRDAEAADVPVSVVEGVAMASLYG